MVAPTLTSRQKNGKENKKRIFETRIRIDNRAKLSEIVATTLASSEKQTKQNEKKKEIFETRKS